MTAVNVTLCLSLLLPLSGEIDAPLVGHQCGMIRSLLGACTGSTSVPALHGDLARVFGLFAAYNGIRVAYE